MDELEALVALVNLAPGQSEKLRVLLKEVGSPSAALSSPSQQLAQLPGFGEQLCGAIRRWDQDFSWRHDLELAHRAGVKLIPFWDSRFPPHFRDAPTAPLLLYVLGSLTPADQRGIAVVGTRRPSIYGGEMAVTLSKGLAAAGYTVISGLSAGIDTLAHRAALSTGRTLAVLGCGLDSLYPCENARLAKEITQYGALVSELPMSTPAKKETFARRHQLISGLAGGVVLVEAPIKSGAMATMRQGWRQKKILFAFPGRADTDSFRGNHWLIKRRCARLIETEKDVIEECTHLFPPYPSKHVDPTNPPKQRTNGE